MRSSSSVLVAIVAVGCGGMTHYDAEQEFVPAPQNGLTELSSHWIVGGEDEAIEPASALGQVYRFEFAYGHARLSPKVMALLSNTLIDDLAVEILSADIPMNDVILAGTILTLTPVTQDACVPTQEPLEATFDEGTGQFNIDFAAGDLKLGQPFDMYKISLAGTWDEATFQVNAPRIVVEADLFSLAEAIYGSDKAYACDYFEKDDLTCQMCEDGPCIKFTIDGFYARNVSDFAIEPLSTADVAAGCF